MRKSGRGTVRTSSRDRSRVNKNFNMGAMENGRHVFGTSAVLAAGQRNHATAPRLNQVEAIIRSVLSALIRASRDLPRLVQLSA